MTPDDPAIAYGDALEMASRITGKFAAIDEENRLRALIVALWQNGKALVEENDRLRREQMR